MKFQLVPLFLNWVKNEMIVLLYLWINVEKWHYSHYNPNRNYARHVIFDVQKSEYINSGTDTIRSTSSPQH